MKILAITNLYPTHKNPACGTFVEQQIQGLLEIGLLVEVLHIDRGSKGILAYLGLARKVRLKLKEFQPDLVHVMYGGVLAEVVTRVVRDRPVMVSFCGTDLLGGSYFPFLRRLMVQYDLFASRLAARRAKGIVVKSANLKSALPSKIGLDQVQIIPNGVDLNKFTPCDREESRRQLGWADNAFHIITTAYPGHIRKRFALVLATVERLREVGLSVELHQLRGLNHSEVPLWLNASDTLILTSSHEGSPNIVKEALACNRPVVSVDVGDVREWIEGIEGCYLAKPTPEDLAAKILKVFNGCRLAGGRVKMHDFSLEHIALRLKDFYSHCLNKNSSVSKIVN